MTNTSEEITEELNFEIRKIWDNKELGIVESYRLEEKLKQKKWFSEDELKAIIAKCEKTANKTKRTVRCTVKVAPPQQSEK